MARGFGRKIFCLRGKRWQAGRAVWLGEWFARFLLPLILGWLALTPGCVRLRRERAVFTPGLAAITLGCGRSILGLAGIILELLAFIPGWLAFIRELPAFILG
jgi:hypothetical protein